MTKNTLTLNNVNVNANSISLKADSLVSYGGVVDASTFINVKESKARIFGILKENTTLSDDSEVGQANPQINIHADELVFNLPTIAMTKDRYSWETGRIDISKSEEGSNCVFNNVTIHGKDLSIECTEDSLNISGTYIEFFENPVGNTEPTAIIGNVTEIIDN